MPIKVEAKMSQNLSKSNPIKSKNSLNKIGTSYGRYDYKDKSSIELRFSTQILSHSHVQNHKIIM